MAGVGWEGGGGRASMLCVCVIVGTSAHKQWEKTLISLRSLNLQLN